MHVTRKPAQPRSPCPSLFVSRNKSLTEAFPHHARPPRSSDGRRRPRPSAVPVGTAPHAVLPFRSLAPPPGAPGKLTASAHGGPSGRGARPSPASRKAARSPHAPGASSRDRAHVPAWGHAGSREWDVGSRRARRAHVGVTWAGDQPRSAGPGAWAPRVRTDWPIAPGPTPGSSPTAPSSPCAPRPCP